jgi:cytochrome c-type biogenesis protein CcmE
VFYAKDKAGSVSKVIFTGTKPTDFEKAESIVLLGKIVGNEFYCSQIQMKCPSKYKNDQVAVGKNVM